MQRNCGSYEPKYDLTLDLPLLSYSFDQISRIFHISLNLPSCLILSLSLSLSFPFSTKVSVLFPPNQPSYHTQLSLSLFFLLKSLFHLCLMASYTFFFHFHCLASLFYLFLLPILFCPDPNTLIFLSLHPIIPLHSIFINWSAQSFYQVSKTGAISTVMMM